MKKSAFRKYPLKERIGHPELLVGRKSEFAKLDEWLQRMPMMLSQSIALLARKKSGKTAILQRLFNQLWSAGDLSLQDPNSIPIIPIYIEIGDKGLWYPHFAIRYYRVFASQYISYLERDESLVQTPLDLEEIRDYGKKNALRPFVRDVESLWRDEEKRMHDSMWETASWAPHRFASLYDQRIVVMIDEFQNISRYIYRDEPCQSNYDETMPGSYHELAESKVAPMLVTGSYVGWLVNLIDEYLEGGRLAEWEFSPYLPPEEGLEAVYQYATSYESSINNITAASINELCMADPYFISCVIQSRFPQKELMTKEGVVETVNYELSHRKAQFAKTWSQYINSAVDRINDQNAKNILLHLSKYSERTWTHLDLKKELNLDLEPREILQKLVDLFKADLIEEGTSDIEFRGLQDGTLYLILKSRFGGEIKTFSGDLKEDLTEKHDRLIEKMSSLQGKVNALTGKLAEDMLATEFRNKKEVLLSSYFSYSGKATLPKTRISEATLQFSKVKTRFFIQADEEHPTPEKNLEFDIVADTELGQSLLIEMKKRQDKMGIKTIKNFWEKVLCFSRLHPDREVFASFFSAGGFTAEAQAFCEEQEIGVSTQLFIDLSNL